MSERLAIGHFTRVGQAVGRVKRRSGCKFEQLKRKLIGLECGQE